MAELQELKQRIAAVHETVQGIVNENIAARAALDASNAKLAEAEQLAGSVSPEAARFLATYRNPVMENPPPLVPGIPMPESVPVPPITEEPTVFTDVSTSVVTPDNTSGGHSEVAADMPLADAPAFNPEAAAAAVPQPE